jgi:hypothetical protein
VQVVDVIQALTLHIMDLAWSIRRDDIAEAYLAAMHHLYELPGRVDRPGPGGEELGEV